MCEWRPHLKTDEEILAAFRGEMKEDIETVRKAREDPELSKIVDEMTPDFGEWDDHGGEKFSGGSDDAPIDTDIMKPAKPEIGVDKAGYKTYTDFDTIIPGHAPPTPVIEELFDIKQEMPSTINQALDTVNPHYNENKAYRENCSYSTVAHELQRRGYRIEALPMDEDQAPFRNAYSAFVNEKGDPVTPGRASTGKDALINKLKEFPDGSRFLITQNTKYNEKGHDYIAEKINGKIRFLDSQQGNGDASGLPDKAISDEKGKRLWFARIDNARLNPAINFAKALKIIPAAQTKSRKNVIPNKEGSIMTKEEAKEILLNSPEMQPKVIRGDLVYQEFRGFTREYNDGFGFAVTPYTKDDPPDPTYAFEYFVDKKDRHTSSASAPMSEDELANIENE